MVRITALERFVRLIHSYLSYCSNEKSAMIEKDSKRRDKLLKIETC